ncbi:uncharacterized protein BJ212DRAFT_1481092 [Suillus subaureus]|uniref:Uncharacterized protein n=1 Tax=Suillus subaureus TaxID=48587 RepID=A0A9P7EAC6_9AGAM|nr:uncharacterized protein BJ212DRAFT_1481092 [Suillus subaureus]KAG1816023.1 hypothetical protein BJ212DRAFT_1481092 [Suillus subaureus]
MGPPAHVSHIPSTSPPSALTSASWGKRKASALKSDVDSPSPSSKCSCPPSVAAKAQQEGSTAISSLASTFQEMSKPLTMHIPAPMIPAPPPAPPSDFTCAVKVLTLATNISDGDKLEMMPLFLKNKDKVVVFLYMNANLRAAWVQKRLAEVHANMNID